METNVDSQLQLLSNHEMTQCSAGLSENLLEIQCVGQNYSHFKNLGLKITVFLDGNNGIAKNNPGL